MFGKKKEADKKQTTNCKTVSKPAQKKMETKSKMSAKKSVTVKQTVIGFKKKTIELTELEAQKAQACISLLALQDEIRATKLDRKEKLSKKEEDELQQCHARSAFYNALAKKFK